MRMNAIDGEFLSIRDAVAMVGVSRSTFYAWVWRGFIKTYPTQTKQLVKRSEMMELMMKIK